MDYLKKHLDDYEDATQKEPRAKRALIHALYRITALNEIIEREVKDKSTFDALFEKCVSSKAKFTKELGKLTEELSHAKKDIDIVRNDRKKRDAAAAAKPPIPPVGGGGTSTVDEDPIAAAVRPPPPPVIAPAAPKKAKKSKITLAMREQIWKKYIGRTIDCMCPVCQTRLISMTDFSAGHITAEAMGGATDVTNLLPICGNCNSRMSTENLFEYTLKNYMREPVFPGTNTVSDNAGGSTKKTDGKRVGAK
jgi:hypothetical protein